MSETILAVLAVVFAAFCVWLTVRIVNRRERWAKRTAVGLVMLLAYLASFGPACWLYRKSGRSSPVGRALDIIYVPLGLAVHCSTQEVRDRLDEYRRWWTALADP